MSLFRKREELQQLAEMNTRLKILAEELDKTKATLHTLVKHVKFLVYTVRVVNPELKEPESN